MFRRKKILALWFALLLVGAGYVPRSSHTAFAQDKPAQDTPAPEKKAQDKKATDKAASDKSKQIPTAEQVAESVIFINGTRAGLTQVRHSGVERGIIRRNASDGKVEELTYERRFIHGDSMDKDRIRLEQKMPTAEYALIYSDGQVWGILNDTVFTPRSESSEDFTNRQWHGLDALLRYKENGATLNYIGKDKQKGIDMHVLDVTDKQQRKTRYYISAKTLRVLALEYELPNTKGKFMRKFYDYRVAQGTLVPYRSILYRDDQQVEETQILTVTYGLKVDEAQFKNPESPATTSAATP